MSHPVKQGVKVVQSCKYASNGSNHFYLDKNFPDSLQKFAGIKAYVKAILSL